jgi:hypothetical protein
MIGELEYDSQMRHRFLSHHHNVGPTQPLDRVGNEELTYLPKCKMTLIEDNAHPTPELWLLRKIF